jgi:excisionase family DNA binding protein
MEITKQTIADCIEYLINKDIKAIFAEEKKVIVLTIKDIARYLQVSERTAARLVYKGDIRSVKIGGVRRILVQDFINYLSKL